MEHEDETIKQVWNGDNLFTLLVLPSGDHWISLVTHTDMSRKTLSHVGRWLHQPKHAPTREEAWKQAETFLQDYQRTHKQAT